MGPGLADRVVGGRHTIAVAVLSAALLFLTGCGLGDRSTASSTLPPETRPADPMEAVMAAVDATFEAGSAELAVRSPSEDGGVVARGGLNLEDRWSWVVTDACLDDHGQLSDRSVSDPETGEPLQPCGSGEFIDYNPVLLSWYWVDAGAYEMSDLRQAGILQANDCVPSVDVTPVRILSTLRGALLSVDELGSARLKGEPVTGYRVVVDGNTMPHDIGSAWVAYQGLEVEYVLFVDEANRIRQLQYRSPRGNSDLVMELSAFGDDVRIWLPVNDELVDADDADWYLDGILQEPTLPTGDECAAGRPTDLLELSDPLVQPLTETEPRPTTTDDGIERVVVFVAAADIPAGTSVADAYGQGLIVTDEIDRRDRPIGFLFDPEAAGSAVEEIKEGTVLTSEMFGLPIGGE